jgi:hypothetical protein
VPRDPSIQTFSRKKKQSVIFQDIERRKHASRRETIIGRRILCLSEDFPSIEQDVDRLLAAPRVLISICVETGGRYCLCCFDK